MKCFRIQLMWEAEQNKALSNGSTQMPTFPNSNMLTRISSLWRRSVLQKLHLHTVSCQCQLKDMNTGEQIQQINRLFKKLCCLVSCILHSFCLDFPKEPTGSKHLVSNHFPRISVLTYLLTVIWWEWLGCWGCLWGLHCTMGYPHGVFGSWPFLPPVKTVDSSSLG